MCYHYRLLSAHAHKKLVNRTLVHSMVPPPSLSSCQCWCLDSFFTAGLPLSIASVVFRRWCPPARVPLLPRTDSLIISTPRRPHSLAHPTIVSSLVSRPRHLASLLTNGNFKLCYHEFPALSKRSGLEMGVMLFLVSLNVKWKKEY